MASNFVPPIPSVEPFNYGQGYGDWHKYAGLGTGGTESSKKSAVPPPAPNTAPVEMKIPDFVMPDYNVAAAPQGVGMAPSGLYQDYNSLVKQAKMHFGE